MRTFPARGTWIEIQSTVIASHRLFDVPRKGNVDRNADEMGTVERQLKTFPARGTWIEMSMPTVST